MRYVVVIVACLSFSFLTACDPAGGGSTLTTSGPSGGGGGGC